MAVIDLSQFKQKDVQKRMSEFQKYASSKQGTSEREALNTNVRQAVLAQLIGQEQAKKQNRGFIGNLIGGFTDPLQRIGESALGLAAGTPQAMSYTSQQQFAQNPNRFALQRLADIGSLGLMAIPGAGVGGSIGKAALLGAGIGGLGAVGSANPEEDLLQAGLSGAAIGGITGGALQGIGNKLGKMGGKVSEYGAEIQKVPNKSITKATAQMSPEMVTLADSTIESVGGKSTNEIAKNLSNEYNRLYSNLSKMQKGLNPQVTGLSAQNFRDVLRATIEQSPASAKLIGDKILNRFGSDVIKMSDLEWAIKQLAGNPKASTQALRDTLVSMQRNIMDEAIKYPKAASWLQKNFGSETAYNDALQRMSDIHTTFSVKDFGNAGKAFERVSVPFLPVSVGIPTGLGETLQKARYGVGEALKKTPEVLGNIGNLLQQPYLQKAAEFLPQQVSQQAPIESQVGMPSVVGSQETSTASNAQRAQLFSSLLQQGAKPSEAKTIVDMLMPEEGKLNESQQKRMNVARSASSALQTLQSNPKVAGKLATAGRGLSGFFGTTAPEQTSYAQDLSAVNSAIQNMISGTSLTASEKKSLAGLIVNPTDEPRIALVKLQKLISQYGQ